MGWFSADNKPAAKYTRKRISVSSISHHQAGGWLTGHGPDKRKKNKGLLKSEGPPIDVKRTWGGYKVIDGNDRLYYARQAGRRTIAARVWD